MNMLFLTGIVYRMLLRGSELPNRLIMDSSNRRIKCALLNAQSVRNKTRELRELICEQGIDAFAITETWLSACDNLKINELLPDTHKLFHTPRNFGQGGGVGIVLSNTFTNARIRVVGVFILMWLEDYRDTNVKKFIDIMNNMNFVSKVNVFTSRSDHILDAVFCFTGDNYFMNLIVEPDFSISFYHKLIMFDISVLLPSKLRTKITFRNKRLLDSTVLIDMGVTVIEEKYNEPCGCTDLNSSRNVSVGECVVCLVALYFSVFSKEYDKMCPVVEKDIVIKDSSPWFNAAIREARKRRRLAESRWHKHKTKRNRMLYVEARMSNDPFQINEVIDAPNIDRLLQLQLRIVNLSITKSLVPSSEKVAIIKPSLKGSLDHQLFKSYRPISNLSFLSKMIETSVLDQLS
ncbi:uncharacterized protein [Palaemon carinicauda]|uniref:uncharacterized protein n=1 Tax=Palaemon carinicauda TaxID=392227 RepID=UPI0035B5FB9C